MGFISLTRERKHYDTITTLGRNIKTAVKKERIPNLNKGDPILKETAMS